MYSLLQTLYQIQLITKFVNTIFPQVNSHLERWQDRLKYCSDQPLALQALLSIKTKSFHALGGSIYALYPGVNEEAMVNFIVALQTISDYLDNLCDRADCLDEAAFRRLHVAMYDALMPDNVKAPSLTDYYSLYPYGKDGGYLESLVGACQKELAKLPNYKLVEGETLKLVQLYTNLQSYKHTHPEAREALLTSWIAPYLSGYPGIRVWEFAAATGSTLGIFMLVAAAFSENLTEEVVNRLVDGYFPWISGLHIMLDYVIDGEEDRVGGDFNFAAYYQGPKECSERMVFLWQKAKEKALSLPNSSFHLMVIEGLLALYLSDPKALQGPTGLVTKALLQQAGGRARQLHRLCLLLRKKGII